MDKKDLVPSKLSKILKNKSVDTDFISGLKIAYRPYMCPFDDILLECETKKSIFDIGCGSGMFLSLCAEFLNPSKLGGIEISDKLISNTKSILSDYDIPLNIKKYDGKRFPKEIHDYDIVTIIDILHHIPKDYQIKFLEDLIEKVKKGTKIIIKDINADSKLVYFNKLHDLIFSGEKSEEISLKKLLEILNNKKGSDYIGNVRVETVNKRRMFLYPHYLVVLYKL